jgi:5'-3' exonuclease
MRACKLWIPTLTVLCACGGAELNQTRVTEVQAAVLAAEQVGASDQPKAALHLQLAMEKLESAWRLAADGDQKNSNLLLERAKVDAELSLQLARTEREQESARQAWEKIRDLKKDSAR